LFVVQATLQDVVKLYQAVQTLPRVAESVASCSSAALRERFQGSLVQLVSDFANLCNMVECTLDLEALGEEGAFRLRPSFDERLQVLHAALAAQRKVLKAEQARAGGWAKKVELEDKKGHGWVLRCSKQQEKGVKDSAKKDGVELTEVSFVFFVHDILLGFFVVISVVAVIVCFCDCLFCVIVCFDVCLFSVIFMLFAGVDEQRGFSVSDAEDGQGGQRTRRARERVTSHKICFVLCSNVVEQIRRRAEGACVAAHVCSARYLPFILLCL
jgi:hypothetical protein